MNDDDNDRGDDVFVDVDHMMMIELNYDSFVS